MAFNVSNPIGTGSDQELLDLFRACLAKIAVQGQSYTIGDRTFTSADIEKVQGLVEKYEARISNASGGLSSAINYARRRRPA